MPGSNSNVGTAAFFYLFTEHPSFLVLKKFIKDISCFIGICVNILFGILRPPNIQVIQNTNSKLIKANPDLPQKLTKREETFKCSLIVSLAAPSAPLLSACPSVFTLQSLISLFIMLHQSPPPTPTALPPHLRLNCCLCLALDDSPLISYSLWTNVELCAITKAVSSPKKDSVGFARESLFTLQTYELRFSDLSQLVHMLAGQSCDRQGLNDVRWQNSVSDSPHQRRAAMHKVSDLAQWLHEKVPQAFPQVLGCKKIQK